MLSGFVCEFMFTLHVTLYGITKRVITGTKAVIT
jgi:hypothetical protein